MHCKLGRAVVKITGVKLLTAHQYFITGSLQESPLWHPTLSASAQFFTQSFVLKTRNKIQTLLTPRSWRMWLQESTRIYAAPTCTCSVNCKPAGLSTISLETVSLKNQYYIAQVCPTSLNQRIKPVIPTLRNDPTLSASSSLKKIHPHTHSDVSDKNRCVRVLSIFPLLFILRVQSKKSLFS